MSGFEYSLYLDDIGSGTPGLKDDFAVFGLGGCLMKRSDEPTILKTLRQFKQKWGIKLDIPLHGSEIRSRKERYRWLRNDEEECKQFKNELLEMVLSLPVVVHGCIVDRVGYYKRYHQKYSRNPWNMRKSAALIILERSAKYVQSLGGRSLTVTFELCGKAEDTLFRQCYNDLRNQGNQFDQSNSAKYKPADAAALSTILSPTLYAFNKDNELLQIADACLFPLATSRSGKPNAAFEGFKSRKMLIDELVSEPLVMGAKFYCFD